MDDSHSSIFRDDTMVYMTLSFGGNFIIDEGQMVYCGGDEIEVKIPYEEMSYDRLMKMLRDELCWETPCVVYYCLDGEPFLTGRRHISDEQDCLGFKRLMLEDNRRWVQIYVECDVGRTIPPPPNPGEGEPAGSVVASGPERQLSDGEGDEVDQDWDGQWEDISDDDEEVRRYKGQIREYKKKFGMGDGDTEKHGLDSDSGESHTSDLADESTLRRIPHKYPVYKSSENPTFQLSMTFKDVKQFREACRKYGCVKGYNLLFKVNRKDCVKVLCAAQDCNWFMYASWEKDIEKVQLKKWELEHTYCSIQKNKMVTSTWLAETYAVNKLSVAPELRSRQLRDMIKDDLNISISANQARKTKRKAMSLLRGNPDEEYARLGEYSHEIRNVMPGSTVEMQTCPDPDGVRRFDRIYVCLEPCKKGFKSGCRPVLGLDGCFLKTEYEGQLLAVVGRDADNHMFPVAWAVVQRESNDTWDWFINLLRQDIETANRHGYTIISDQQKGLVNAVGNRLPDAEHRLCTRHLLANFIKRHKDADLQDLFWEAVNARTTEELDFALRRMREKSNDAANELVIKNTRLWSRAYHRTESKCDSTTNNLSEGFNASIYFPREKYIYSLLDDIRVKCMVRMHERRDEIKKWNNVVGPGINKIIKKNIALANCGEIVWNGSAGYEVTLKRERFTVKLDKGLCSCRRWQVSGIPYAHACCVIVNRGEGIIEYVSDYFKQPTALRIHSHLMTPMDGPALWERRYACEPILPPLKRQIGGRPKKKRRRAVEEVRRSVGNSLNRKGCVVRCSFCKITGHNRSKCPSRFRCEGLIAKGERSSLRSALYSSDAGPSNLGSTEAGPSTNAPPTQESTL